jgi:hypothetical protein
VFAERNDGSHHSRHSLQRWRVIVSYSEWVHLQQYFWSKRGDGLAERRSIVSSASSTQYQTVSASPTPHAALPS